MAHHTDTQTITAAPHTPDAPAEGVAKKTRIMREATTPPVWFTTLEICNRWKICSLTIRRWRHEGKLKASFFGRGVRISAEEVERIEREAQA